MSVLFVAGIVVGLIVLLVFIVSGGSPAPKPAAAPAPPPRPSGGPPPSSGPPPTPKQFHYGFTYVTLPGIVLANPGAVHRIESEEQARKDFTAPDGAVGSVWRNLAKQLGLDAPYAELSVSIEEQPWGRCVLVTMPEPMEMPLAYFIALVPRGPDKVLYLTLERSMNGTMIGGVAKDARHINFGRGPGPDKTAFLEALGPIVTGSK